MIFGKREDEELPMYLVRWTARVSSVAILFMLMLFAFGRDGITQGISSTELVGLVFFPAGVALGFVLGWMNELFGGLLSVASLGCFYLVYGLALTGHMPQGVWFAVFTAPGFLFFIYGVLRILGRKTMQHRIPLSR